MYIIYNSDGEYLTPWVPAEVERSEEALALQESLCHLDDAEAEIAANLRHPPVRTTARVDRGSVEAEPAKGRSLPRLSLVPREAYRGVAAGAALCSASRFSDPPGPSSSLGAVTGRPARPCVIVCTQRIHVPAWKDALLQYGQLVAPGSLRSVGVTTPADRSPLFCVCTKKHLRFLGSLHADVFVADDGEGLHCVATKAPGFDHLIVTGTSGTMYEMSNTRWKPDRVAARAFDFSGSTVSPSCAASLWSVVGMDPGALPVTVVRANVVPDLMVLEGPEAQKYRGEECPVCLIEYTISVATAPCGHSVCTSCYVQMKSSVCPLCRADMCPLSIGFVSLTSLNENVKLGNGGVECMIHRAIEDRWSAYPRPRVVAVLRPADMDDVDLARVLGGEARDFNRWTRGARVRSMGKKIDAFFTPTGGEDLVLQFAVSPGQPSPVPKGVGRVLACCVNMVGLGVCESVAPALLPGGTIFSFDSASL